MKNTEVSRHVFQIIAYLSKKKKKNAEKKKKEKEQRNSQKAKDVSVHRKIVQT